MLLIIRMHKACYALHCSDLDMLDLDIQLCNLWLQIEASAFVHFRWVAKPPKRLPAWDCSGFGCKALATSRIKAGNVCQDFSSSNAVHV